MISVALFNNASGFLAVTINLLTLTYLSTISIKGQLISELNFDVFKSPKKPTKVYTDFCPLKLGKKFAKNLVGVLRDLKALKLNSEIN